jgi:hypothetical protein
MVKIAFWDNCLSERGTTVAMYDYAYYNEKILGNESIVLYNTTRKENDNNVIEKFKRHFKVFGVTNFDMVDTILLENNIDILYVIKAGEYEGQISRVCKTVVHCVFNTSQPHGNVYAAVSKSVGNLVVPHIVSLPDNNDNMRIELGIPDEALVFGRYGGMDQFDIKYVQNIVYDIAKNFSNIYFLFMNTHRFCPELPNIIHIEKIVDLEKKVAFINTCDAMLWARSGGETFGLSIAEFSIKNKPVIATKVGDTAHVDFLGDKGIWYNENNLYQILTTLNKKAIQQYDWNAYRDYSPEKVMKIFKEVFIDSFY